jgi:dimethylaniline monooxygenase (N-oxide forming)
VDHFWFYNGPVPFFNSCATIHSSIFFGFGFPSYFRAAVFHFRKLLIDPLFSGLFVHLMVISAPRYYCYCYCYCCYFSFSERHKNQPPLRVAVIGAGVAGLQTLRALKARGIQATALEASSNVGGVWRSNYDNFGLQVPKQLYEFQDFPMDSCKWGEYPTGPQVQNYIERFTDSYDLRKNIQFNTKVTSVVPKATTTTSTTTWTIQLEQNDGKSTTQEFDYLVVATGLYGGMKKNIPTFPGQDKFKGTMVHSTYFTDAASLVGNKNVLVIGGGKSAIDCAVNSARAGASSVTLLQRTAHWPTPRNIAGLIPFQYVFLSRLGTALVSTHVGTFPGGSGKAVNAFRNSIVGPWLMKGIFGIVETLFAFQFALTGSLRPKGDVVEDFYDVAFVLNSDLQDMRKSGQVKVQMGEVEKFTSDGTSLNLKDGSVLKADVVVAGSGFQQDYSMFTDPKTIQDLDVQKDGLYLYRYILPEKVDNLAFIGHVASASHICTQGLQAEWLARHLTGTLAEETTPKGMHTDIEARKKWARSWMPERANRSTLVLLHQKHYHDQLIMDMGLNPHRKSNIVAEYLMPYESSDYNGIIGNIAMST